MPSERKVKVRLTGDVSPYNRAMLQAATSTKAFAKELDTSNDRMSNLVQTSLAIGPALVPIGAALIPAISGLTNQLAIAATAAGVTALAFSGVGDALKATNDYAIEPTAANFDKMQQSLVELGPAGREFVGFLQEIRPQLQGLQDAAQAGLFPGAEAGIRDLLTVLPQAERIIGSVADGVGTLIAEAGDNLTDPRWAEFFNFIEAEARPTLLDFGRTMGNLAEGFANLWMAFDPLSDDFSASFLQMSRDFAAWSDGLSQTEGFQEFVDYIQTNGPRAWETLGALGNALLQIVEAAAPVGSLALPVIEALADALATVADSDLAPAAIGIISLTSALSRFKAVATAANSSAVGGLFGKTGAGKSFASMKSDLPTLSQYGTVLYRAGQSAKYASAGTLAARTAVGKLRPAMAASAGVAGAFALSLTDVDDKLGISNTATYALAGTLLGPWGTAVGAGVGLAMDFAAANDDVWAALNQVDQALSQGPANIQQQADVYAAAAKKIDEFKAKVDDVSVTNFDSLKNSFEDAFGRSDVEEAQEALSRHKERLDENARAAQDLKFQEAGLGISMDGASASTRNQAEAMIDLANAHAIAADETLKGLDAQLSYEAAIDAAAESVKKNGRNVDDNTEAGRQNLAALYDIADGWNSLDAAGYLAKGGIDAARKQFIGAAIAAGKGAKEARQMANDLLAIPTSVTAILRVRDNASPQIGGVAGALAGLNGKTATVYIRAVKTGASIGAVAGALERANGGIVAAAGGGYIQGPGTTTSDSIPAWLSDQEYVVKASSVAKYGVRFMDDVNAGRFANGGLAGASPATAPVAHGGPLEVSLVGTKIAIDPHTSIGTFVDGRIRVGIQQNERYRAAGRRAGRG